VHPLRDRTKFLTGQINELCQLYLNKAGGQGRGEGHTNELWRSTLGQPPHKQRACVLRWRGELPTFLPYTPNTPKLNFLPSETGVEMEDAQRCKSGDETWPVTLRKTPSL